ncbi:unnamed protein product, partial [Iphiclides podalirius]
MTVMSEVPTRRSDTDLLYKPTVLLRKIWRRTLSFKRRKSEDRFAGYKGVRDITIKKGPSGLGIMIIEGRHTEAGRGIFVSDLQEGSAAEQAGLQIGDMILAVNRDSLLSCSYDAAAAKLKNTEGVVILTVCSPNMKDPDKEDPSGASGANSTTDAGGASRPQTPRPAPSPAKPEPPPDPATAPIKPNQEMVIEINTANENLGVVLLGGSDTLINGAAAVVLEVVAGGALAKDGRLQPGDQIRECNGVAIADKMAHERRCLSIKLRVPKLRLTVFRPEPIQYEEVEVELARKGGRALGICCRAPPNGPGLYINELLSGSPAEVDGRLQKGDLLLSVDGKDLSGADLLTAATALKLCANKVAIKVKRFKIIAKSIFDQQLEKDSIGPCEVDLTTSDIRSSFDQQLDKDCIGQWEIDFITSDVRSSFLVVKAKDQDHRQEAAHWENDLMSIDFGPFSIRHFEKVDSIKRQWEIVRT